MEPESYNPMLPTLEPGTALIAAALFRQEEALLRRMLCAWDPAWGEPELVMRGKATPYIIEPTQFSTTYTYHSRIVGLCAAKDANEHRVGIIIWAYEHIGDDGKVLPPIADKGQLAIFEARLQTKVKTDL